jgi:UDP-glucose 4-epimerase
VDRYVADGHEVVIVDDLSTGYRANLNPRAKFYQADIRSPEIRAIFEREQPEVVNHHAAQMNVRRSVADPFFDADVNILGSLNLIEASKATGVLRFIYVSTGGAVYGEPIYLPCDEKHPIDPICQYGISKHTVEHYLYLYCVNYGLNYTVLRYPNVYGPRQDPHGEAGVVAIFTGQMLAGEQVVINGDGEQVRDFVYVSDVARASRLALTAPATHGIFNLGSGTGTSVNQVFAALKQITGYARSAEFGPAKVGETRQIYLDGSLAHAELGWQAGITLEQGLAETVAYFKSLRSVEAFG